MRTDRELSTLFAGAIVDETPDPVFLDELFEVLRDEVESVGLARSAALTPTVRISPRVGRLARPSATRRGGTIPWPLAVGAAAVLALVVGAVVLRPASQIGPPAGPTPSAPPSQTPGPTWQVAPSASFKTFTSTTYGYTIGYPSNWKTHESPGRLDPAAYPYDFSGGVDYLSATSPDVLDPGLIVAGPRLTRPTDLSAWMANIAQLQATTVACGPPDGTEPTTVAGVPAQVDTWQACPEYILWAGFVRGGVAYHVLLIDEFATDNPPLQAADHDMFMRMLGSFAFTGPVQTFGPSPTTSAPASSGAASPSR